MAERRVKPGWWVLGGLALAGALWVGTPRLLRRVEFFRVRQVELVGLRYLSARDVLTALAVPPSASLVDDPAPIAARAAAIPGVAEAEVTRRWPRTLRVRIREVVPVALAPLGGRLVPIDARGRRLPFDPALGAPDVPVVAAADSTLAAFLGRMQALELGFFAGISAAWRARDDIVLDWAGRRLLLRPDASAEVIRAVMLVTEDLARTGRAHAELDGRFAGQIVVRPRSTAGGAGGGA